MSAAGTTALQDLLIRVIADSTEALAAFEKTEKKADEMDKRVSKATSNIQKSYDRIPSALSRVDKAQLIFNRKIAELAELYKRGAISEQQYTRGMIEQEAIMARTVTRFNQMKTGVTGLAALMSTRGLNGPRAMGTAIQQAGYQVGDFAVQVASGQSAMRAFIQQGTQLISMFGPFGAVLGAVGAIGGAIWVAMDRGSQATKEAKRRAELYAETLTNLEDAITRVDTAQAKLNGTYRGAEIDAARRAVRAREKDETEALAKVQAARQSFSVDLVRRLLLEREYAGAVQKTANARTQLQATELAYSAEKKQDLVRQQSEIGYQSLQLALLKRRIIDEDEYNLRLEIRKAQLDANVTAESTLGGLIEKSIRDKQALTEAEKKLLDQRKKEESEAEKRDKKIDMRLDALKTEVDTRERLTRELVAGKISIDDYKTALDAANVAQSLGIDLASAQGKEFEALIEKRDELKAVYDRMVKNQEMLRKAAEKESKETQDAWDDAFDKVGDSIEQFVETGKLNFKELTLSIIADIAKMQLQRSIIQPFQSGIQSFVQGMFGGNQPAFAAGGPVRGPGGPTDDKITARLSNGEFVVNAKAAARYDALLKAINSNKPIKAFKRGGPVTASGTTTSMTNPRSDGGVTIQQYINIETGVSQTVRAEIARLLPEIERRTVGAVADARGRGK